MSNWETETVHEIWNNSTGEHYKIGPDRDGLDLVEVRSYTDVNSAKPAERMTMPREVAVEVGRVITKEYGSKEVKSTSGDRDAADARLIAVLPAPWLRKQLEEFWSEEICTKPPIKEYTVTYPSKK